jgi:hypothetical protein
LGAEKRADLCAAQPSFDDHLSGEVDAVNLKPVLGKIETGSGSCGSSKAAFRNRRFPGLPELPRVPARRFAKSAAAVWIAFINVLA